MIRTLDNGVNARQYSTLWLFSRIFRIFRISDQCEALKILIILMIL